MDIHETTRLVRNVRGGDPQAVAVLLPLLYNELRALAARIFAKQPAANTLQPTALLHEAYLKLVDQSSSDLTDRVHFYRLAAKAMRQVLIDHARANNAAKRGGGVRERIVAEPQAPKQLDRLDWLALDEAISKLGMLDARQAAIVEMRFFGGMTTEETAAALGVSTRTVELDWRTARAWLSRFLNGEM
ncbi:MAG TPA: ECF-type sigma factor [Phycisphaerales bacterium]|nr:ECF-type sigma factor [Phycisphaerales bacterium]HRQ75106.1 ECF-type sigma factor [Phycisphaerales bacterium]